MSLTNILGGMMATGMAGRSRRGPSLASSPGGFQRTAGMAALGILAYKAYQQYQRNNAAAPMQQQSGRGTVGGDMGGQSLGERLAGALRPEQRAAPEQALGDQKALLLIRAMIAAAASDGEIGPQERQRILDSLEQAGATADDRQLLERELAAPQSMDGLLRDVRDEETAEQVYLASAMAIDADTPSEKSYLQYLASRLGVDPSRLGPMGTA